MSAIEVYLTKTALGTALKLGSKCLEDARGFERETMARCVLRLQAAHVAVKGLEDEYDEILRQVTALDPLDSVEREYVLARIDRYLRDDNLRPVLAEATAGLRISEKTLRANADAFFGVPHLRRLLRLPGLRTREEVVEHFSRHLAELIGYLAALEGNHEARRYHGPSGVGFDDLLDIEEELKRPRFELGGDDKLARVKARVGVLRAGRTHAAFLRSAESIGELTAKLEREFR